MEFGLAAALVFAVGIIVLAVVLTKAFGGRKLKGDINRSDADGRGAATWIGIREAGKDDLPPGEH